MEVVAPLRRPAIGNYYSVAGRYIFVESDTEWCATLFDRYFESWQVAHLEREPPALDCLIKVALVTEKQRAPSGAGGFEISGDGYCHTVGETIYLEYAEGLITIDSEDPPTVKAFFYESILTTEAKKKAAIVFNVFGAALRRCALLELHGGGVEDPLGRGVIIAGPSGSGKSTLTSQLAVVGWRYLSDDALMLSVKGDVIAASGLRRAFALTEETIAASGLEHFNNVCYKSVPFEPTKRRFEPQELFPGGLIEESVPRALFFPRIMHEPSSRAVRLSQFETMSRLLRLCPWACYDRPAASRFLNLLARLSKQCVAFDLLAGKNLLGDASGTARFFHDCMDELMK